MKISWLDISQRITFELQQREEEGNNVSALREEWIVLQKLGTYNDLFQTAAKKFYRRMEETQWIVRNEKNEPSDRESILKLSTFAHDTKPVFSHDVILGKILGGWLGRSAGCLLGKPIEKIPREGIKELLLSNNSWPISDYITANGIPTALREKYPWNRHYGKESLRENILCMTEDDDMNYPMLNLLVYERYKKDFTSEHVIQTWMESAPVLTTFTAERIAYYNALAGMHPPKTATENNPYREWIGAQIRADLWGWISPSQPARAAEFAWRDARVSHIRNGIYGEMFFAAAIALAFKHDLCRPIIEEALLCIPMQSRFAEAIRFVLSLPVENQPWDETVDKLYEKFGNYHWVHTINNAALVVAALLSSKGDYEKAICNVVMGGWDTDSNGATVGSIMGTMLGAEKLPSKWIAPLNDTIRSSLKGFDKSSLSGLAKRTAAIARYSPLTS